MIHSKAHDWIRQSLLCATSLILPSSIIRVFKTFFNDVWQSLTRLVSNSLINCTQKFTQIYKVTNNTGCLSIQNQERNIKSHFNVYCFLDFRNHLISDNTFKNRKHAALRQRCAKVDALSCVMFHRHWYQGISVEEENKVQVKSPHDHICLPWSLKIPFQQ